MVQQTHRHPAFHLVLPFQSSKAVKAQDRTCLLLALCQTCPQSYEILAEQNQSVGLRFVTNLANKIQVTK